jgi:hypothetical protein
MWSKLFKNQKLRTCGRFMLGYVDVLAAIIFALIAIYLSARGDLHGDVLTEANIALIIAVTLVIFRDRWERQETITQLQRSIRQERKDAVLKIQGAVCTERTKAVAGIERAISALNGSKAWRILEEHVSWDLFEHDGSRAKAIARKVFMFNQDEVLCVYEYQLPPVGKAEVTKHLCFGGEHEPLDALPIIQTNFSGPAGRMYRLISLRRVWRREEIMHFRSERDLKDHFLENSEHVSKEISSPTASITIEVKWPLDRAPRGLSLERTDRPRESIDTNTLALVDGRQVFNKTIPDPVLGECLCVSWTW